MRFAIVGGPGCGKTTQAKFLQATWPEGERGPIRVYHTDDAAHLPWKDQAYFWLSLQYLPGNWILEGIQTARVLRKGLNVHKVKAMFDPKTPLNPKQRQLMKSVKTIWRDVKHGRYRE